MFLQLLGFAVALTMTATASAKAVSHDLPNGQACETSLRTEPKRAYYDPAETYGTTAHYFYNYSTLTLKDGTGNDIENQEIWFINQGSGTPIWFLYNQSPTQEDWDNLTDNYDLYENGVLVTDPLGSHYYQQGFGPSGIKFAEQSPVNPTSYYWLFNHESEPKGPYYDPTETYGNTTGKLYNYTGQTLNIGFYTYETDAGTALQIENNQSHNAKLMNFSGNVAIPDGTYNYTQFTTADNTKEYDIYADGVYKRTLTLNTQTYTPCYLLNAGISEAENTNHYFWLFEHALSEDEKREAEIGGIFTEVGNVVTGMADTLTKPWDGIVNIFYDTTAEEVTPLGMVSLITLGTSVVIMLFAIAIRLFRQRG